MSRPLAELLSAEVTIVAHSLLGARLLVNGVGGIVTETEAYHPSEPASHAHRGETPRNRAMFLGPGHSYVYRSYGLHWCFNIVCANAAAVLIRALEPTDGIESMVERRGLADPRLLCTGPGRLCAALDITARYNGLVLPSAEIALVVPEVPPLALVGPRIGISKAADLPWRFGLAGSKYLSRGFASG